MSDPAGQVATWRKVLAAILDFLMVFFGGGYAIGRLTGNVTAEGFKLEGAPALLLFALIIVYFVAGSKYLARYGLAAHPLQDVSREAPVVRAICVAPGAWTQNRENNSMQR